MKWAVLSDVHGNLHALEAVLTYLEGGKAVDGVLFLGDAVGYGAHPNECMDLLRDLSDILVMGNHDWAVTGKAAFFQFNDIAREALVWTDQVLLCHHRRFLEQCPLMVEQDDFLCVHATPQAPERWDYLMTWDDVEEAFQTMNGRICFVGHSHVPLAICEQFQGQPMLIERESFELEQGMKYIINPGSVGQPRDGDPRVAFGIWDVEDASFTLVRIPYDIQGAAKAILSAGLPHFLAERLYVGR